MTSRTRPSACSRALATATRMPRSPTCAGVPTAGSTRRRATAAVGRTTSRTPPAATSVASATACSASFPTAARSRWCRAMVRTRGAAPSTRKASSSSPWRTARTCGTSCCPSASCRAIAWTTSRAGPTCRITIASSRPWCARTLPTRRSTSSAASRLRRARPSTTAARGRRAGRGRTSSASPRSTSCTMT